MSLPIDETTASRADDLVDRAVVELSSVGRYAVDRHTGQVAETPRAKQVFAAVDAARAKRAGDEIRHFDNPRP